MEGIFKRQRRPNFTNAELKALVLEMERKRELATGCFVETIQTPAEQRQQWDRVATVVNAAGNNERSGKENSSSYNKSFCTTSHFRGDNTRNSSSYNKSFCHSRHLRIHP